MDKSKGMIAKIKALFAEMPVPETAPAPATPTEYTLEDGVTIAKIDKLEVGGIVTVNDAPAVDGSITLADGTKVTTVGGVITGVEAKAAEAAEEIPMTPAQMKAEIKKFADAAAPEQQGLVTIVKALFESVFGWELRQAKEKALRDAAIATYQTGFEEMKAENIKLKADFAKIHKIAAETFALVEHIGGEESETPAEDGKDTPPKKWEDMSALERHRFQKAQWS